MFKFYKKFCLKILPRENVVSKKLVRLLISNIFLWILCNNEINKIVLILNIMMRCAVKFKS